MEAYTKYEYIEEPKILPLSKDHVQRMAGDVSVGYLPQGRLLHIGECGAGAEYRSVSVSQHIPYAGTRSGRMKVK